MNCGAQLKLGNKYMNCHPPNRNYSIQKDGIYLDGTRFAKTIFSDGVFTEMQKNNGELIALYMGRIYYKKEV